MITIAQRLHLPLGHQYLALRTMQSITFKPLKEKLPQAFVQIGWMEDNFRNLTAKVWANLDNPIKIYDFSKVSFKFVYVALSGGTLLISVMSKQYNLLMELYTNFYKILLFMKMYLPSYFILRYVRAEINVHAFMNELDQKDLISKKNFLLLKIYVQS